MAKVKKTRRRRTQAKDIIGREEKYQIEHIASEYAQLGSEDEEAGRILLQAGKYRGAAYLCVQAMEKYLKHTIFKLVNPAIPYYRNKARTHDIDDLLDFLIEIVSPEEVVKQQVRGQLNQHVIGNKKRFKALHNDLRYPAFRGKLKYSIRRISEKDTQELFEKLIRLKKYLQDIHRLI